MARVEEICKAVLSDGRSGVPVARDILACVREYGDPVYIEKDGRTVSAGSMIGLLSLGLQSGDVIKVICSGADEFSAKLCLEKICNVIC